MISIRLRQHVQSAPLSSRSVAVVPGCPRSRDARASDSPSRGQSQLGASFNGNRHRCAYLYSMRAISLGRRLIRQICFPLQLFGYRTLAEPTSHPLSSPLRAILPHLISYNCLWLFRTLSVIVSAPTLPTPILRGYDPCHATSIQWALIRYISMQAVLYLALLCRRAPPLAHSLRLP